MYATSSRLPVWYRYGTGTTVLLQYIISRKYKLFKLFASEIFTADNFSEAQENHVRVSVVGDFKNASDKIVCSSISVFDL